MAKTMKLKFTGDCPSKMPGMERVVTPGEVIEEVPAEIVEQFELLNGNFEEVKGQQPQKQVEKQKEQQKGGKK
jgi:hypothetical protein